MKGVALHWLQEISKHGTNESALMNRSMHVWFRYTRRNHQYQPKILAAEVTVSLEITPIYIFLIFDYNKHLVQKFKQNLKRTVKKTSNPSMVLHNHLWQWYIMTHEKTKGETDCCTMHNHHTGGFRHKVYYSFDRKVCGNVRLGDREPIIFYILCEGMCFSLGPSDDLQDFSGRYPVTNPCLGWLSSF